MKSLITLLTTLILAVGCYSTANASHVPESPTPAIVASMDVYAAEVVEVSSEILTIGAEDFSPLFSECLAVRPQPLTPSTPKLKPDIASHYLLQVSKHRREYFCWGRHCIWNQTLMPG